MEALVADMDERPFRAGQLYAWTFFKRAAAIDDMTDVSKSFRAALKERSFYLSFPKIKTVLKSADGTVKMLLEMEDSEPVECVLIPEKERLTLCISTQCGCSLKCAFCLTGEGGAGRNLTVAELVGEVMAAEQLVREGGVKGREAVTNIVLMGMGEPLLNYDNVIKFLNILIDPSGMAYGARKVTVSTAGVAPALEKLGYDTAANLAVSLNATTDDVRNKVMPINKKYPLKELFAALRRYPLKPRRRITFEYVLLKGVNDSIEDARRLCKLLEDVPSKINLIAFNPFPGAAFKRPERADVLKFQKVLLDAGYTAVIRESRGSDILAACGQLKARKEKAS